MQLVYMLFDRENETIGQATFEIAEAIACGMAVEGSLQVPVDIARNENGAFVPTEAGMNIILAHLMHHAAYKDMEAGAFTKATVIKYNESHGTKNPVDIFLKLYEKYNNLNVPIRILE